LFLRIFSLWLVVVTILFCHHDAEAKKRRRGKSTTAGTRFPAQEANGDGEEDAFDPFADFSEFESNPDEQEDLNFFRNARMLTLGFQGGMINYTNEMAHKFQSSFRYGVFISYFFDLNFAVQLHWNTTNSPASFRTFDSNLTGNASLSSIGFAIKYFLNTQNVSKGLADLNPYFMMGVSNYNQKINFSTIGGSLNDTGSGFSGGMGIEVPMLRKKLFWGAQLSYDFVGLKNENVDFIYNTGAGDRNYGSSRGDFWNLMGSIGLNF
jgi:hypothetical protein